MGTLCNPPPWREANAFLAELNTFVTLHPHLGWPDLRQGLIRGLGVRFEFLQEYEDFKGMKLSRRFLVLHSIVQAIQEHHEFDYKNRIIEGGLTDICRDLDTDTVHWVDCQHIVRLSEPQECPTLTIIRLWEGNPAISHQQLPILCNPPLLGMARSLHDSVADGLDTATPQEQPRETVQHEVQAHQSAETTHTDGQSASSYAHAAGATTREPSVLQEPCELFIESVDHVEEERGNPGQVVFCREFKARQYFQPVTWYMEAVFDVFVDYDPERDNILRITSPRQIEGWLPEEEWRSMAACRCNELISCIMDWVLKARRTGGSWPDFARHIHQQMEETDEATVRRIELEEGIGGLITVYSDQNVASY